MRRSSSAMIAGLAVAALAAPAALNLPSASAAPPDRDPVAKGLLGVGADHDLDRRRGEVRPTAAQEAAARRFPGEVRWNEYGTPASVVADRPLARDLPASPDRSARAYLSQNRALFGLDEAAVDSLETLAVVPVGEGSIVTLRQRVDGLPLTQGGLVTVAVRGDSVLHVSSSLTRDTGVLPKSALDEAAAQRLAVGGSGLDAQAAEIIRTRRVAVPTPSDGTRSAYEVVLAEKGGEGAAFTVLVDSTTGDLLVREDLVDHLEDNAAWELFGATPPDEKSTERETWCWNVLAGCEDVVDNGASPLAWDVDPATEAPTGTTDGNNALSGKSWDSLPQSPTVERTAAARADREYVYDFQNVWRESQCDPEALTADEGNDIDAATASLFAHHNRLHDFSYQLGFTEETWNAQQSNFGRGGAEADPEIGKAQSGARLGYRDNANQYTPPDGVAPWSNMYLWQPIAGGAYVPCVDGDFDGTVIGHEYTHMISNRMVAGPDAGLSGYQARGMGESWSDLVAMEYLFELGKRPKGDTPYVTGAYVTGDDRTGIRNYDMSRSPLNYSNVGYDVVGLSVHSEGEIWSATNYTLRQAMVDRYGSGTPALQRSCADGETLVAECPGNRRWVQLVFDSFLVPATGSVSMLDMRDAMLVADRLRFDGDNQMLIWDAFAQRGMGQNAVSKGADDVDPVPDFASPSGRNGTVEFRASGLNAPVQIYIGDYEKQAVAVADTDASTDLRNSLAMVPGRYDALAVGPAVGHQRFSFEVKANGTRVIPVPLSSNLAAAANGATATGHGDGAESLVDGTETTSWEAGAESVDGLGVTVDLAGDRAQQVGRVNVSAFYESGSRFSALRQFRVLTCDAASGQSCDDPASFAQVYLSPADAFPGDGMRPTAPDLNVRSFAVPRTMATHVRFEVVTNQCTGGSSFQGELDNDPDNPTDCPSGAPSVAQTVRAAEFQVFGR
ncbi:MAG: M36 family metallopeptidase [Nocardioidaceae bacterium]